jgi:crotonobetainyl-CoA:carnitine CoA-transferase CaiB-like acyl-CoA transferase
MGLPLAGIRVLSAAQLLPGAYCTMLLADMGADVIMLERPQGGDPMRLMPDMFSAVTRGKKSITVNLASEKGKEICYKIVKESPIFLESFRPGVAKKLRIDYDTLKAISPGIVYASITGFGQEGPYRHKPGHDLVYQGIAGMLSGLIPKKGAKFIPPQVAIADWSSGMFAAISILGALYGAKETGVGQYIDVSMTDGLVSFMGRRLAPNRDLSFAIQPTYTLYTTSDGKSLTLGIGAEEHFWRNLCKAVGKEELGVLSAAERAKREEELYATFADIFMAKTRDQWIEILTKADVPHGPAYSSPEEVLNDPQLRYRGMIVDVDDPEKGQVARIRSPLRLSGISGGNDGQAPKLGEHNEEILLSLGYERVAMEEMRREGAI